MACPDYIRLYLFYMVLIIGPPGSPAEEEDSIECSIVTQTEYEASSDCHTAMSMVLGLCPLIQVFDRIAAGGM